jgi:hypothetical protein
MQYGLALNVTWRELVTLVMDETGTEAVIFQLCPIPL